MRTSTLVASLVLLLPAAVPARAQQFTDATSTWFPADALEWSNQVTAGDLDGDGDLDLVFANGGNFSFPGANLKVRVFINALESSRFLDLSDERTGGVAGTYRGVELGDCDRDGDLDILLASDFDRLPELLINDGTGFFSAEGSTRLPAITLASSRGQFGDVDNDGDLDVFLTSGTTNRFDCGQYRLYLNDGTCHYTDGTATHFPLGNECENMDAIFGDLDGDFDVDIRTASTGPDNSRTYFNDGNGVFSLVATPPDNNCYSYDLGDIDGDGDLDMIGANGAASSLGEMLLRNDGGGVFTNVTGNISPNPNEDDNDSKFIDYDNDGDLDLLIARLGSGGEKLYANDSHGNFTLTSGVFEVISDSSLDIIVGDFNNDGNYDVVTAQGESGNFTNRIYMNNGPADTLPPRIIDVEQLADTLDQAGPYVVRTLVLDDMTSDRNFFDKGIILSYVIDGGTEQTTPMRHSGGQVYRGEIPGQANGAVIDYWVTANDYNDNAAVSAALQFTVLGSEFAAGRTSSPLLVGLTPTGRIALEWGASCTAGDDDYAVYTNSFGNFTHPLKLLCSTGGMTSTTFFGAPGNRYFLVVPHNDLVEGSYGKNGDDVERNAASNACQSQFVADCP